MKVSLPAQPALRAAMIAPAAPKPPATDKATTGGRAEEIFTGQLDQVLAEKISEASGDRFGGPMYELFLLGRK